MSVPRSSGCTKLWLPFPPCSPLHRLKKGAVDARRQAADAKARLETTLADQRRLALQVGKLEAARGGKGSSSPAKKSGTTASDAGEAGEGVAVATQVLTAQAEAVALRRELTRREGVAERQATEIRALQALLSHQQEAGRMAEEGLARERERCRQLVSSGGGAADGPSATVEQLRVMYFKTKSALDDATAANARLRRELAEARTQVAVLLEQAAAAERWQQHAAEAAALCSGEYRQQQQQQLSHLTEASGEVLLATSKGSAVTCSTGACMASPGEALRLRQQLAAARHRAAQLEIELEGVSAKLAIHQAHTDLLKQERVVAAEDWQGDCIAAWRREGQSQEHPILTVQAQRLNPRSKQALEETPAAAVAMAARQAQTAAHENVIELQLHSARLLDVAVLGPHALTFLSADFYAHATSITSIGQGSTPAYASTLQFVVPEDAALRAHCASDGAIRLELHACQAAAASLREGDGPHPALDYTTVARGSIPLRSLLEPREGGGRAVRECSLVATAGADERRRVIGSVQYSLAVLRPLLV